MLNYLLLFLPLRFVVEYDGVVVKGDDDVSSSLLSLLRPSV